MDCKRYITIFGCIAKTRSLEAYNSLDQNCTDIKKLFR